MKGMERSRLLIAIYAMAKSSGAEDEQLRALRDLGFDEGEAHRLVSFVPVAMSRPILEQLGVTNFSDVASVPIGNEKWLDVRLGDQPEYTAALAVARDHMANGMLLHDAFTAIVFGSADVAAVSEALNSGADIKGAAIATAFHDTRLAQHVIL